MPYSELRRFNGENNSLEPSVVASQIKHVALEGALSRLPENPVIGSEERVRNAIERRFAPYVEENESIARQITTPEYEKHREETSDFLDARVGIVICPDGRIIILALGDPGVLSTHRRLMGSPETRTSTSTEKVQVLDDPTLSGSITAEFDERKTQGENLELVEFLGPHILSTHPEHGCGALSGIMQARGHTPQIGMRMGGIAEYFEQLNEGFYAFNTVANRAGGHGTTYDVVHDAYSQGLIVGLRDTYTQFDTRRSLRENLINLQRNGEIVMTEMLDDSFAQQMVDLAQKMGMSSPTLPIADYKQVAKNRIIIGQVAREATLQEEKDGYPFIPTKLLENQNSTHASARSLTYHLLGNVAYRVLGGIQPGQHRLLQHPEQLIRIGPIGADFNITNIPFIERTPAGSLRPEDIDGALRLYKLAGSTLEDQGINLTVEGRIILVTGEFDETQYANPTIANKAFYKEVALVANNAAKIREALAGSIATGEAIVIASLHTPGSRKLTHIIK